MKNKLKRIAIAVMATAITAVNVTGISTGAEDVIMGDANGDGKFTVADVVLFQNWIIGKDVTLNNYQAVDFCEDGVLDIFDLSMMKKEYCTDEFRPYINTSIDVFVNYVVVVTMKQQYPKRVWTAEDFKDVENIDYIQDVTPPAWSRQTLHIFLKERSKENVLKMIHDIESLNIEEIYMVRPTSWEPGLI
ncbi:MAG: dockerin type I repeat-containing protein [Ruminococcus sp.]|nr:dockerin type I repeat-containing protein [Ruminococcus sp.]